jgi:hypothetical protein
MHVEYTPPPTVGKFLQSTAFAKIIMGPVGSGKTTGLLFDIPKMAAEQRKSPDGVRRFRAVIVRNTYAQLQDTSLKSWFTWFPEHTAGDYARTNKVFTMRFDDVECEVWFRPLDTAEDVKKLLSVEASVICFDEAREINPEIWEAASGRVGRYPSKKDGGPYKENGEPNFGLRASTNPPDADTYWADLIENPPANTDVFIQPSALSPEAENMDNLPDHYYENLCQGKKEDWIDVYVRSKMGKSLSGQPVFGSFDSTTHVAKEELKPSTLNGTLFVGIDNGLSPAAVFGQVDFNGRILAYDAIYADGLGALRFCRERLKPLIARKYPGFKVLLIADPACNQRAQTDEKTIVSIYKSEGFQIVTAKTNSLAARIASVDYYLTRTVEGKSSILLCPVGCKPLIQALRGKYKYRTNTKGETDTTPEKSHPYSDLADGLQYLALHASGGSVYGATTNNVQKREVKKTQYAW